LRLRGGVKPGHSHGEFRVKHTFRGDVILVSSNVRVYAIEPNHSSLGGAFSQRLDPVKDAKHRFIGASNARVLYRIKPLANNIRMR
jgi:hypothetical protein